MTAGGTRVVFSPFARIEGDIRIEVALEGGAIAEARATGTCFRGFEPMLRGRDPRDALVITPRVCGQCSLSHLAAASAALGSLSGAAPPRNGQLAIAVMLGAETILNHLTHFYLSFAPDLAVPPGDARGADRFRPNRGESFRSALEARREFLPLMGLFAGKWPNSLAVQPGGTTRAMDRSDLNRASGVLLALREFVEARFLGDGIEGWLSLRSGAELLAWLESPPHAASDVGLFMRCAIEGGFDALGRGPGAYVAKDGFCDGVTAPLSPDDIEEHARYSWFEPPKGDLRPSRGRTVPAPERPEAYSWTKAPRYRGRPAEAGPLARMAVAGDPLVADLLATRGPGVLVRELARLHEMVRLIDALGGWIGGIRPGEPFLAAAPLPDSGEGVGLVEAPRGLLGHWVSVRQGRIQEYQIVTPTAWNFSPRDGEGTPGPVESALVGARHAVAGCDDAALVVRSFDPCLFCAVH